MYLRDTEIRECCSFFTGDLILSNCFDPKFVTAYSEFIKLFLQKLFFTSSGQRDYSYFCCIVETTFLLMLIGLAPRRDIREIFLFQEIYTQHSHVKAR